MWELSRYERIMQWADAFGISELICSIWSHNQLIFLKKSAHENHSDLECNKIKMRDCSFF